MAEPKYISIEEAIFLYDQYGISLVINDGEVVSVNFE